MQGTRPRQGGGRRADNVTDPNKARPSRTHRHGQGGAATEQNANCFGNKRRTLASVGVSSAARRQEDKRRAAGSEARPKDIWRTRRGQQEDNTRTQGSGAWPETVASVFFPKRRARLPSVHLGATHASMFRFLLSMLRATRSSGDCETDPDVLLPKTGIKLHAIITLDHPIPKSKLPPIKNQVMTRQGHVQLVMTGPSVLDRPMSAGWIPQTGNGRWGNAKKPMAQAHELLGGRSLQNPTNSPRPVPPLRRSTEPLLEPSLERCKLC